MQIPVDDACRIQIIHRCREPARVSEPDLPAAPQVRGALQRPVLPIFGELGYLTGRPWIFAHFEVLRLCVVPVTHRVSSRRSRAYDNLPEAATVRGAIYPGCERFA